MTVGARFNIQHEKLNKGHYKTIRKVQTSKFKKRVKTRTLDLFSTKLLALEKGFKIL